VTTGEIREVNIGFNRMAQQLAKVEQDRAVMLAGISHDLRTPLARLRLETEMSVAIQMRASTWPPTSSSWTPSSTSSWTMRGPIRSSCQAGLLRDAVVDACTYSPCARAS
jgi:two-component system osmolarity sensor histidine kinase EnvZ